MFRLPRGCVLAAACTALAFATKAVDTQAPAVLSIAPAPGRVSVLTEITVTFTEPVIAPSPTDLLINGNAVVIDVSGSNAVYTFKLEHQPAYGTISISWDPGHGIFDLTDPPNRFNELAPSSTWQYQLVDSVPPTVSALTPAAGVEVRQLTQIDVMFSEAVAGVDAEDLLINGTGATSVSATGIGRYRFSFPQPTNGAVQIAWSIGHGIYDLAAPGNPFGGGAWTYTLDSDFELPEVRLNEFLASNVSGSGLKDENGELEDWIEIYNGGTNPVNLTGWSLTDDPDDPGKWTFPPTNLGAGQFLVVFASGKDRKTVTSTNRFHTNFKLNPAGDYLALFNAELPRVSLTEFKAEFPEQRNDYSYGYDSADTLRYFSVPTPGRTNGSSAISGIAPPPHFSVQRGLFDSPFTLNLSTPLLGATIRYTINGSEPSGTNGTVYPGPLQITNTAILRAATFQTNLLPSATVTHTYIFLDQVLRQPNSPPGFPVGPTVMAGFPSDYEMDPEIVTNALYSGLMKDALKSLPIISVVCKVEDMFGPVNGIYTHPTTRGPNWEKPCSVEFIPQDSSTGFQVNAGVQIQGNAARDPQKQPKHPFRLVFKGDYGPSRLNYQMFPDSPVNNFDTLILRADFNFSWLHWNPAQRPRGQRIRDAWMKDSMRAMGGLASHNRYVHLYINGLYWGLYDPTERPDAAFAASYLGGEKEDYDVINEPGVNGNKAVDGNLIAYNQMLAIANLADNAKYELMKQYLDIPQFADYMLLHFYAGHQDWGNDKNWYATRRRESGATFKYIPWDGENILDVNTNYNRVIDSDVPSGLHTKLLANTQYRLDFADRVHKHFFNNGALTPNAVTNRWNQRVAQVDLGIIAESARWGDYRRDVHQYQSPPYELFTRNNQWLTERNRLLNQYFPVRTGIVLNQLRAAGLYPNVSAPLFNQPGGRVARGFNLSMSATNTIYYTTNGIDPRVNGTAGISPQAQVYSGPVSLSNSVMVKARALFGAQWSALNEANFFVETLGVPLRVAEIMYNPIGGDAYEFIELQNIGPATLDIGGFSFIGITYIFPPHTLLEPGQIIVLGSSSSPNNWTNRYPNVIAFGRFDGALSNGGERLALLEASGQTIISVDYDDENGWPTVADGGGYSLEIIDVAGDPDDPANWRASAASNGTPGLPSPTLPPAGVVLNEVMADNVTAVNHAGTYPDWVELYNPSSVTLNLAAWSLSDDGNPRKFVFPGDTSIPAAGFLMVWCDALTNITPGLHAGFALNKNGDSIFLYNASTTRVDAVSFGLQLSDYSIGRLNGNWELTLPTTNAANVAAAQASATNAVINEWLANPPPGEDDWMELFNRSSNEPVALRHLYLGTSNALHQLGSLSFLAPRGYVQLFADEDPGPDHLDFKLPAAGGAIYLYDGTGSEIDRVIYGAQAQGVTEGRLPDGASNSVKFIGSASPAASNYLPSYSGPVLNEVLVQSAAVNPWGEYAGFVELFNPSGAAFDLSGMSLGTSPLRAGQFVFPAGTMLGPNSHLLIWCDGSRPASLGPGPNLNSGFSLSGNSGGVHLFNALGQLVDFVNYGFQVEDLSIGLSGGGWRLLASPTPAQANSGAATLNSPAPLRFNEWMASPQSGEDWFELYNISTLPVALSGLHLTDDPSLAGMSNFRIAPLSFIGGHCWVKWEADEQTDKGTHHVNFKLDGNGETLRLYDTNFVAIDTVSFGLQQPGVSEGRLPDGGPGVASFPNTPTPGTSNFVPLPNAVINEMLAHADAPLEQAVEIYNPSSQGIDLSGWYLSDSIKEFRKYRIPDGTVLPAGAYLVFYEKQFNSALPVGFKWEGVRGGTVYLAAADAAGNLSGYRAEASFGAAEPGVSFGRYERCAGGVDFVALSRRSFGEDEPGSVEQFRMGHGLFNAYPHVGPVVINELMYHPPGVGTNDNILDEYIELHNVTTSAVVLHNTTHPTNGWRLRGGVEFEFSTNVTLAGGSYLLVVNFDPTTNGAQLASFRNLYGVGAEVKVVGPYGGKLDNGGESVELYRPGSPEGGLAPSVLVDRVEYDDEAPWPAGGDGDGASLQRVRAGEYGNESKNWIAAGPTAGRANGALPPLGPSIVTQPLSRAVRAGSEVIFSVTVCGSLPVSYQWRYNGMELNGETNGWLKLTNVQAGQVGKYAVEVRNAGGTVISEEAILAVMDPPFITVQPVSQTVFNGTNVLFSITANGPPPLSYQWRFNGIALSGETSAALLRTNVQGKEAGDYSVAVSNPAGEQSSEVARLTVKILPAIVASPTSLSVLAGSNITFNVIAIGTGALNYQWRLNGANLAGATHPALLLTNLHPAQRGLYTVVVTDEIGSSISAPATLTVLTAPVILQQPQSQTVVQGDNVTFRVILGGSPPFGFRWRAGTTAVVPFGQGMASFTITNVQLSQAADYSVLVTNVVNRSPGVLSSNALLTVLADSDGDHVPDDWEIANGFNHQDGSDGALDADGDGMTNSQEYLAGTDPHDLDSVLRLSHINVSGEDVRIGFRGVPGRKYRLERLEDLANDSWKGLSDFRIGSVRDVELIDAGAASRPHQMYRVRLVP